MMMMIIIIIQCTYADINAALIKTQPLWQFTLFIS